MNFLKMFSSKKDCCSIEIKEVHEESNSSCCESIQNDGTNACCHSDNKNQNSCC